MGRFALRRRRAASVSSADLSRRQRAFRAAVGDDGPRWLAYASDETGRYETYARTFPDGVHNWQVSNAGGVLPQWRRDGRELFYIAPGGALTAVAVDLEAADFGIPETLFDSGLRLNMYSMWMNQYAVAGDGQLSAESHR